MKRGGTADLLDSPVAGPTVTWSKAKEETRAVHINEVAYTSWLEELGRVSQPTGHGPLQEPGLGKQRGIDPE